MDGSFLGMKKAVFLMRSSFFNMAWWEHENKPDCLSPPKSGKLKEENYYDYN